MANNLESRLTALEQRHGTPTGDWPDLVVLSEGEALTAHQQSAMERAARTGTPTLTVIIGNPPV